MRIKSEGRGIKKKQRKNKKIQKVICFRFLVHSVWAETGHVVGMGEKRIQDFGGKT
jgi:hypothetical protein